MGPTIFKYTMSFLKIILVLGLDECLNFTIRFCNIFLVLRTRIFPYLNFKNPINCFSHCVLLKYMLKKCGNLQSTSKLLKKQSASTMAQDPKIKDCFYIRKKTPRKERKKMLFPAIEIFGVCRWNGN